jgi:hypothetical protein
MEAPVIASVISATTALIAAVIGPIFTFRASKNNMIGPMRQAWINSLRDTTAEFIAHTYISRWAVVASTDEPAQTRKAQEIEDRNRVQLVYQLKEKVWLLINPKEPDHQELARLIENAYEAYFEGKETGGVLQLIR